MTGINTRLASLLNAETGRSVIVAFDHGTEGAIRGGEDPVSMLATLKESGCDGVLLTPGLSARYGSAPSKRLPALLTGIDLPIFGCAPGTGEPLSTIRDAATPTDALRYGAAVCKVLLPLGWNRVLEWGDALDRITRRANECEALGIPLMVEPAFWGAHAAKNDGAIVHAARLAVELGAHVLKLPAPVDSKVLADIVAWSPAPVYILGGDPDGEGSLSERIVEWMNAGAVGVVVGRNVWNRRDPAAAIAALQAAVHDRNAAAARKLFEDAGAPLGV